MCINIIQHAGSGHPGLGLIFQGIYCPQIKADRRKSHKCKKLQLSAWVQRKGQMLSVGWSSGEEGALFRDVEIGHKSRLQTDITVQPLALLCGLEKVPSESIGALWQSLNCCQGTSAGTQAGCCEYPVGLGKTKMTVEVFWSRLSLHSSLLSYSGDWSSAELLYLHVEKGVWGYNYTGHWWCGCWGDTVWSNSPRLHMEWQTMDPVEPLGFGVWSLKMCRLSTNWLCFLLGWLLPISHPVT